MRFSKTEGGVRELEGRSRGEVNGERGEEESYNKVPDVQGDFNCALAGVCEERAGSNLLACVLKSLQ